MLDHLRNPLVAAVVGGLGASNAQSPASPDPAPKAAIACTATVPETDAAESPGLRLQRLLDEDLRDVLRRSPLQATVRGIPGYNDLLPDVSLAGREREGEYERCMAAAVQAIDPAPLNPQDRISLELLRDKFANAVERQRYPDSDALILTTLGGLHNIMPRAAQVTPFRTADDYRDYIKRLAAMPRMAEQTIERLEVGLRNGWLSPTPVLDRVVAAIDSHLVERVDDSILLAPFKRIADGVPEGERAALVQAARRAVEVDYQPALRRFKGFIVGTYRPKAPAEGGLAGLPGGSAFYEYRIRSGIGRDLDAATIHALGLAEVKRVRDEIAQIAKRTGFAGSTDEFIRHLSTDPKFFFASPEALLAAYRAMAPRVDPQLPKLFHAVPRMPYAIRAMTPSEAASSTAANYTVGSLERGTSAYFTINALGHASEATWRVETLFLHETVPGHHLQIARAAELDGLSAWRRLTGGNVAYTEGWALYAETLGFGLGLFKDPYQHYGHLQAELFRAARLVVDTGIHAYRWSRARSVAYMTEQAGVDPSFAVSEVDRYASNPTQALGYLMGKRKILELRARAERALGPRFDLRDFHAVLIDNGAMPLSVLESVVTRWIAEKQGGRGG